MSIIRLTGDPGTKKVYELNNNNFDILIDDSDPLDYVFRSVDDMFPDEPFVNVDEVWGRYPDRYYLHVSTKGRLWDEEFGELTDDDFTRQRRDNLLYKYWTFLDNDGVERTRSIQRIVFSTFYTSPINWEESGIRHLNGNSYDNSIENLVLEW